MANPMVNTKLLRAFRNVSLVETYVGQAVEATNGSVDPKSVLTACKTLRKRINDLYAAENDGERIEEMQFPTGGE